MAGLYLNVLPTGHINEVSLEAILFNIILADVCVDQGRIQGFHLGGAQ